MYVHTYIHTRWHTFIPVKCTIQIIPNIPWRHLVFKCRHVNTLSTKHINNLSTIFTLSSSKERFSSGACHKIYFLLSFILFIEKKSLIAKKPKIKFCPTLEILFLIAVYAIIGLKVLNLCTLIHSTYVFITP